MRWTNYHTHTTYCDGKAQPANVTAQAIDQGLYALGFSGHSPVPFASDWNMPESRIQEYFDDVREIRKVYGEKIQIFVGLEVDFIPGLTGVSSFKTFQPDFTIGAVHYLCRADERNYWSFDHTPEDFMQGLELYYQGDIRKMVKHYYSLLITMLYEDKPDVIAHLDLIRKFNRTLGLIDETADWYRRPVWETLDAIAQTGTILEINTACHYRQLLHDFYPSDWIIKEAIQRNIPLTINSDAHHPSTLISSFPEAAKTLRDSGVSEVFILDRQGWHPVGFSPVGLVLP